MSNIAELAGRLTKAQREAIICDHRRHPRAGDLFPGQGNIMGQTWLRSNPLFERYFHGGYFAYRLTPLGQQVRAHLLTQEPRK